jgi:hypothetical protein
MLDIFTGTAVWISSMAKRVRCRYSVVALIIDAGAVYYGRRRRCAVAACSRGVRRFKPMAWDQRRDRLLCRVGAAESGLASPRRCSLCHGSLAPASAVTTDCTTTRYISWR